MNESMNQSINQTLVYFCISKENIVLEDLHVHTIAHYVYV